MNNNVNSWIGKTIKFEDEVTEYRLRDNRNHGDFDYDILANTFDVEYLESVGFKGSELVGNEYIPILNYLFYIFF